MVLIMRRMSQQEYDALVERLASAFNGYLITDVLALLNNLLVGVHDSVKDSKDRKHLWSVTLQHLTRAANVINDDDDDKEKEEDNASRH